MRIVSAYDGMACGMLAMIEAGVKVDRYVAFEIDDYANKTSKHNFPMIEQMGNVFWADFTEYEGFDFLIGGSPCTYWSIAKTRDRETVASGMGWELFCQYVRALREVKPKYFIYENNKSMSNEIRASITDAFGFEPICINSGLVSAQNRQRLYWVGIRQADGTYKKANVEQPQDRGILLKDILDDNLSPVNTTDDGRAHTIKAQYYKNGIANFITNGGFGASAVAEPICVAQRGRYNDDGTTYQHFEANPTGKTNTLTTVSKDNLIAQPIRVGTMPSPDGTLKGGQAMRIYSSEGKAVPITTGKTKTGSYAICTDDNTNQKYPVYLVDAGMITVKGQKYPIKLDDGYYIIRKLSVDECKRLQTIPDSYEFPVSNSQAYKMLGNGWTVSVISHLIKSLGVV